MKTCPICKEEKELDCFSINKQSTSGRGSYCKPCHQLYKKKLRDSSKGKEKHRLRNRLNARKLLNSSRCRNSTHKLLNKGVISKSNSCDKCGCSENLEIHHYDYNLSYYISTFCKSCHVDWHSKFKPKNRTNGVWTTGVNAYFSEEV